MIIRPTEYSDWPNPDLWKGEKTMKDEKTIVIDINLNRGLVALLALALLAAAFLGYLAWGQRDAAASAPSTMLGTSLWPRPAACADTT
jgi:hypothetical protein